MHNLSKTFLVTLAAGLLGSGLVSQQAQAAPITGDIDFAGRAFFDTQSLATATRVTLFTDAAGTANRANVVGSNGSFSGIAFGTSAVFNPYTFTPSTPTNPLWTVGGFTFNLATSTIANQSASFLNVTGTGTLTGGAGFDPTPGSWTFTSSSANGASSESFSFAANTRAQPSGVPDGGSALALLGMALVGVEAVRRKLASL